MGTKSLDKITAALELAVKSLRAGGTNIHAGGPIRRKRMQLDEFVEHAATQIAKAGQDEPEVAKRRLAALKRSVDDVIAQVAKMVAEDTESTSVKVAVETAFAPTRSSGDKAMDGLTTAEDQSSSETSLAGAGSVAKTLDQMGKALAKLQAELDEEPSRKPRASANKSHAERRQGDADEPESDGDPAAGADRDGWPLDLSTDAFLKGGAPAETALTWGADPDGVAEPKSR